MLNAGVVSLLMFAQRARIGVSFSAERFRARVGFLSHKQRTGTGNLKPVGAILDWESIVTERKVLVHLFGCGMQTASRFYHSCRFTNLQSSVHHSETVRVNGLIQCLRTREAGRS